MVKNYEIKCNIKDDKIRKEIVNKLKKYFYGVETQIDIYYKVKTGRLKLRIVDNRIGNLIFYERSEEMKKRISRYMILPTRDFHILDEIMKKQFKVLTTIIKERKIFILDNIRIHLDNVQALGKFLEIEILYDNFNSAKKQMKEIISYLDLEEKLFIRNSYSDMLIKKR